MKHLLIAAALAAAPGWALAQASGEVPHHKCEPKPEMPGRVMMQDESVRKRFQADVDKYKNCITAYVEERRAVIKENEKAANGAIDEYNSTVKEIQAENDRRRGIDTPGGTTGTSGKSY
jgi:16S rRNA A1518/A1519 N6-dimethyltransferase RsmA/KsgA/DIM1 with predicted DNA glycosylase/AP lyase activity